MRGGALKPVNDGRQWAHILCAVAVPEVSFDDIQQRTGVNVKKLRKARQKLVSQFNFIPLIIYRSSPTLLFRDALTANVAGREIGIL